MSNNQNQFVLPGDNIVTGDYIQEQNEIIAKHGGMVSGELPRLGFINIIPKLRKEKNSE